MRMHNSESVLNLAAPMFRIFIIIALLAGLTGLARPACAWPYQSRAWAMHENQAANDRALRQYESESRDIEKSIRRHRLSQEAQWRAFGQQAASDSGGLPGGFRPGWSKGTSVPEPRLDYFDSVSSAAPWPPLSLNQISTPFRQPFSTTLADPLCADPFAASSPGLPAAPQAVPFPQYPLTLKGNVSDLQVVPRSSPLPSVLALMTKMEDQLLNFHEGGRIGSFDMDAFTNRLLEIKRNYTTMKSSKPALSRQQETLIRNDLENLRCQLCQRGI
jgi:hypothetical protein